MQLDVGIFEWTLLPVFGITLLTCLLRQSLSELNNRQSGAKPGQPPMPMRQKFVDIYTTNIVTSSRLARGAASLLCPSSLAARKNFFIGEDNDGKLCSPPPVNPQAQGLDNFDATAMFGAMKFQIVFLVLNGGLAYLISYLFSDSVAVKTPFPLTRSFRNVVQRGIQVADLDPSYVSALSWYVLVLFASGSYTHLINKALGLGSNVMDQTTEMMTMMAQAPTPGQFGPVDPAKQFQAENDAWRLMPETPFMENVEMAALRVLRA